MQDKMPKNWNEFTLNIMSLSRDYLQLLSVELKTIESQISSW